MVFYFLLCLPRASSGGDEAPTNVTEKKIRFASVVYSNPLVVCVCVCVCSVAS